MLKRPSCLLGVMLATCTSSFAQDDSTNIRLQNVIVSENRLSIPMAHSSKNVSFLNQKDIKNLPARSLQTVLSFVPGVDVRQRGVGGVQADVGIRGGSSEQTLMLINGIKIFHPQTAHHMMNLPLPLTAINRLDVFKGPATTMFGPNAYAGAINILTTIPSHSDFHLDAFAGDFGLYGIDASSALPVGKYHQKVSLSHLASKGYQFNSDFKVNNIFYESEYALNPHHLLNAFVGYTDRNFGANGYYSDKFPGQWESVQSTIGALSHTYSTLHLKWKTSVSATNNDDEFRLKREDPDFYTNTHDATVLSVQSNAAYHWKYGQSGIGLEARNEKLLSSNLGDRSRSFVGYFLEHRIVFAKKVDVHLGLYSNYYEAHGWKYFPSAQIGFQFKKDMRMYAGFGKSFRIPSFTELYYTDPANGSNPDLLPEESTNYELGWKWNHKKMETELVVFNRQTNNLIDYSRDESDSIPNPNIWTPQNINSVNFTGAEVSVNYLLNLGHKNIKLEQLRLSYNYIHAATETPDKIESRYALSALKQQAILGLSAKFFNCVRLQIIARYLERMAMPAYSLLDTKIEFKTFKHWSVYAEVNNLTNTQYVEAGFVQMPSRWGKLGLRVDLN